MLYLLPRSVFVTLTSKLASSSISAAAYAFFSQEKYCGIKVYYYSYILIPPMG